MGTKYFLVILIFIAVAGHFLFLWTEKRVVIPAEINKINSVPPLKDETAAVKPQPPPVEPLLGPKSSNIDPQKLLAGLSVVKVQPPSVLTHKFLGIEFKPFATNNFADIESPKLLVSLPAGKVKSAPGAANRFADIEPQTPLAHPPPVIKAAYFTSWSAGHGPKVGYLLDLLKSTELNAVVIDIKDYSGYVGYDIKVPEVEKYGAKQIRIPRINALIKRLHDEGIYVIARITIFQDPVLAHARPDLAVQSRARATVWKDRKGLSWMDPASREVWDYNLKIARDAAARGFDELNFDYIRFPSDGDMKDMQYPLWDGKSPKRQTLRNFFQYLRAGLPGIKISADLFGLATVQKDDLGIGQIIEDAYEYFDYVCPMVYPSHYAAGFRQFENPALHPYEVIKYSMEAAQRRLLYPRQNYPSASPVAPTQSAAADEKFTATPVALPAAAEKNFTAQLRPWLQDFNLGARYDAVMVQKEIQAVYDSEITHGWMLWNPSNNYTRRALLPEENKKGFKSLNP